MSKSKDLISSTTMSFPTIEAILRYSDRVTRNTSTATHNNVWTHTYVSIHTGFIAYPLHVHACIPKHRLGEARRMIDRRFRGIKRGINVASSRFIEMSLSSNRRPIPSSSREIPLITKVMYKKEHGEENTMEQAYIMYRVSVPPAR